MFGIHFPHYFKTKLPTQISELYAASALMDFAGSAIALFEPIWLWTLGYGIPQIMVFYLLVYVPYFFLAPLGGKFVARFGPEKSIAVSTGFLIAYFIGLMTIRDFHVLYYFVPLFFAAQKTFYWPAYHFDFMRNAVPAERGREFSGLWTVTTVMYVLGPVVGGLVVKFLDFRALFAGAAVVILLSSLPLFRRLSPPKPEKFSYWKSLVLPFRRRYQRQTLGYLGLGEELIGMTIWPIFILLIFGDLFNVGLLVGVSALITAFVTLAAGRWTDRHSPQRILHATGAIAAGLWLIRLLTRWPAAVFGLDTLGRSNHNTTFVTMTTLTYQRAHDDDYSWHGVYYEQGFAIAKSLTAVLVIILAGLFDPFNAAWVAAAGLSLFYLLF